jgi:hypothetical protein
MNSLTRVTDKGHAGMLVFAQTIRNIDYDHYTGLEIIEYDDRLTAGFIVEVSQAFEQYYLVKYFDGSTSFHWGVDIFYRKEEENNLTYLNG